jgi:hypothetical protein
MLGSGKTGEVYFRAAVGLKINPASSQPIKNHCKNRPMYPLVASGRPTLIKIGAVTIAKTYGTAFMAAQRFGRATWYKKYL